MKVFLTVGGCSTSMTAWSICSLPAVKVFSCQTVFFVCSLLLKKLSYCDLNKFVVVVVAFLSKVAFMKEGKEHKISF